jgi:hypothetical protein
VNLAQLLPPDGYHWRRYLRAARFSACLFFLLLAPAHAAVHIVRGPTPIPGGDARAVGDVTVLNERLAFALAIETAPPYGVPRGALVDLAPVAGGKIGHDKVVFADFIPDNWSAWPNSYHRLTVIKDTPQEATLRSERDWGAVAISTVYTLKAGADVIHITVTMANQGRTALAGLRSGLTLWPSAGYLLAVPGLEGITDGSARDALSDRVIAYDRDWAIALHAPYLEHVGSGSRDLYLTHTLAPGSSRTFESWLQVGTSGDLAPMVMAEISRRGLAFGEVTGSVWAHGQQPVAAAVVVVEKAGKVYGWTIGTAGGRYRIALPAGEYTAYATATGYTQSLPAKFSILSGARRIQNFAGLAPPGVLQFRVTRKESNSPLDARIAIEQGHKPLPEFLGRKVFFTDLMRRGEADLTLAPGDYAFSVSWGRDVLTEAATVKTTIMPGRTQTIAVPLATPFDPRRAGWYGADLHHHADQAEAVTPPADLARAQLAAGLDLLFVSDHDSTVNHRALQMMADRRGIPFLPGIEITTSWGHFNAYPLTLGARLAIDTSDTNVNAVFAQARRMGAEAIEVNHPFIPYGYFTSLKGGVAPGGFNPGFDLVEINARNHSDDDKVLRTVWDYWNAGRRYYLAAGTDTHDVWSELSGKVRSYAHVDGPLTASDFTRALINGHAYVTYGPLIFPKRMFGDTLRIAPGARFELGFDLKAVGGLRAVSLVRRGVVAKTVDLAYAGREAHVDFPLTADGADWFALVVEDAGGRRAYTDPIWLEPAL